MPRLTIHSRNSHFQACDEGADYVRHEAALALGIRGAVDVIADEINRGERRAAVEIGVETEDGVQIHHFVVALSVSPLLLRSERIPPNALS